MTRRAFSRDTEAPKITATPESTLSDTIETHPSYGQIGASRVSGAAHLYGSDFSHQNFVKIEIKTSELHRGHSKDWKFARELVSEVWLSESQWATFVSTLNSGDGTPCTIRFEREGGFRPFLPPPVPQSDKFKLDADRRYREAVDDLVAVITRLRETGRATKKDVSELESVVGSFTRGLPWVAEKFAEHIETTLDAARIEINAIANAQIQRAGLASLGVKALELPKGEDK